VSLTRTRFIDVPPGARPGFDHADVDRAGRRMYVAHPGADRVDVLDCERLEYLRSLDDLPGVAGVLIDQRDDLLFTSDRGAARVSVFRCSDADGAALVVLDRDNGRVLSSLPLPGEPDVIMGDADRRRLYVAIGDPGVVCSFDGEKLEPLETIAAEPGAHTLGWDPDSRSLYVFCPVSGGAAIYEERR
jgi:hypothetical protein